MKTYIIAAAALAFGSSAYAATPQAGTAQHQAHGAQAQAQLQFQYPGHWTQAQRDLYRDHMMHPPAHWSADQRTAFQQQLTRPHDQWTAQERAMFQEHQQNVPAHWTRQQERDFQAMIGADAREGRVMGPATSLGQTVVGGQGGSGGLGSGGMGDTGPTEAWTGHASGERRVDPR
ncbi:MAG: hypothetical protein ACK4K7_12265 [Allosphingosinicella sp.]|uniref:hypothetical protein n=1 Tax=Allosphingosinicella sp. TaxID=2823234 RepID=UPI0039469FA4